MENVNAYAVNKERLNFVFDRKFTSIDEENVR